MKRYFFLIFLFLPFTNHAQQASYKSGLTDYLWMDAGNAGFSPGEVYFTNLAFSPAGIPYVAFEDKSCNRKITVMRLIDKFWDCPGPSCFSEGGVMYPDIAISPNGDPYVVYQDAIKSYKATVKKLVGADWLTVGIPGFSADEADYTSLAINSDGVPYVAYSDKGNSWKASVMKFDGNNWVNVGLPGFSAGSVLYLCLELDVSGVPYVAYSDIANSSHKASVMKFDGNQWVYVGTSGFSAGSLESLSMAISPSGQPYVAYKDNENNTKATVMMFDGNQWVNVGPAGFTPQGIYSICIAFSPAGDPYVAMEEFIAPPVYPKAAVMKFIGMNWVNVGTPGFSEGEIDCPSLGFDLAGQPYLAYVDYGNETKATVKTYAAVDVSVKEPANPEIYLYPNPATEILTIDLKTSPAAEVAYEITDTRGILMTKSRTSENKISVNLNNYATGIYFFRISNTNSSFVGKFCKN
jgi:hypothetical protein